MNKEVKRLWIKQAKTVQVSVNIVKLSQTNLLGWIKGQTHSWDHIDPYSNLEDVRTDAEPVPDEKQ